MPLASATSVASAPPRSRGLLSRARKDELRAQAASSGETPAVLIAREYAALKAAQREARKAGAFRRGQVYRLRLSGDEHAALLARARAAGVSPAQFLRSTFVEPVAASVDEVPGFAADVGRATPVRADARGHGMSEGAPSLPHAVVRFSVDPALVVALNRIGANLNQLARRANSGDMLQPGELPEALAALRRERERTEALVMRLIDI